MGRMADETKHARPFLVVGSTGKTGRRVARRLQAAGRPVREGSRRAPIPFDWEDPSTWAPALEGTRAAYVAFHPDLAVPGAAEALERFTDLAGRAGLERLVLLSGRGEPAARRGEEIVAASGIPWTVVRASWFAQNFSEGFLAEMVQAGRVALPVEEVREPFVDVEDIAEVAAKALLDGDLDGRVVEVTGPRLMTFAEAVGEIATALGRRVDFVSIPHRDFLAGLEAAGVPSGYVGLLDYLFAEVLDGRNASLADGVHQALGRGPGDFGDYVRRSAAAGAWTAPVAS